MNPLSGVFSEAWRMYRAHALHLIVIAFVIYLAAAILDGVISLAGGLLVTFLGAIISVLAAFLVQAALVKAVQDIRDGRVDLSFGETVSAALPSVGPVAVAGILAGIAIAAGFFILIVPGLYLITIWAVIVPVIVIERSGALQSFGRSQQLVRGRGWHVFGTLVLVWITTILLSLVLGLLLSALPLPLRNGLSTVVSGTLVAPFLAIMVTLIYYRLLGAPVVGADGYMPPGGPAGPYGGPGGYGPPPPGGYAEPGTPGGYGAPGGGGYGGPGGGYPPPGPPSSYPPAGPPSSYSPPGPPSSYPPAGDSTGSPPAGGFADYPPADAPPGGEPPPGHENPGGGYGPPA